MRKEDFNLQILAQKTMIKPGTIVVADSLLADLQVGAKVAILQHQHLNCAAFGFVQHIDGSYISVRPEDVEPDESDALEGTIELYPSELKVVAVYKHESLKQGVVVRIHAIAKHSNTATHGIVAGVEAERVIVRLLGNEDRKFASLLPETLAVEQNQANQTAESVVAQIAIMALLGALESSTIGNLKKLIEAHSGDDQIEPALAVLANTGKVKLTQTLPTGQITAQLIDPDCVQLPVGVSTELRQSLAELVLAKQRRAAAIRQVIIEARVNKI